MIRVILLLALLQVQLTSICQTMHPYTLDHGCCSEKTGVPYTSNPEESKILLELYATNNISEKEVFYQGKFDPWKEFKKDELYQQRYMAPPGSLPILEGVFMDQTEVANVHYQEFLFYMVKDSGKYADAPYMPRLDNKYRSKYFLNPEFYFYPVVGVSHENAKAYCSWRAEKVNEELKEILENQIKKYKYEGRLPREEEWKELAGDFNQIQPKNYTLGKKQLALFSEDIVAFRFAPETILKTKIYDGYSFNFSIKENGLPIDIPLYIYSFGQNNGFYNMYGNVKELVEEGYAIGGSFKTGFSADELFEKDDIQDYRTDIGFRCLTSVTVWR